METPAFTHDPTPMESLTPSKRRPKRSSSKPEPRSPGFVLHSRRPNAATNSSAFAEVHQTNRSIRTIFNEGRQEEPSKDSEAISTRHQNFKKQIKRMLQIHASPQQKAAKVTAVMPPVSTVIQQTPGGRKYGQIVTGQPWERELNVSTYNVKKTRRAASAGTSETQKQNRTVSYIAIDPLTERPPGSGGNSLPRSKQKQPAEEARDHTNIDTLLSNKERKGLITQPQLATELRRPHVNAPVIPSPRKSIYRGLGLAGDWAESFSASQESGARASPTRVSISKVDNEPVSRDFAIGGVNFLQRFRDNRRRSRSPEQEAYSQNAVTGLPHNYQASTFPSFRQRIEELQASNNQKNNLPAVKPEEVRDPPPAPPSSPVAINPQGKPTLKPSPNIEKHSKSPSVVSAESAAEDVQSDASSGVVSNAQSAVFMRGQIATGHYHAANTRKPPMPGPPPCGALPSLPEGHDCNVPATPRISESSQRVHSHENSPGKVIVPTKSPRRPEYRFLPSDCSPPKIQRPASSEQRNETQTEKQVIPTPTQVRVKRQGVTFPRPDQLPKSVSAGELDQWQQQRNEKTAARKALGLAPMRSHKAAIEDVDPTLLQGTNSVEHHKGIAMLPSIRDSYASSLASAGHRPHVSQASDFSMSTALQNRESSALPKNREGSTLSLRLSPIMVVAEQEPIPPISRISSRKSLSIDRDSINEEASKSRFSRGSTEEPSRTFQANNFHPGPSPQVSPSLQPPDEETEAHPASARFMPTSRPVASRLPTPFTHALLQAHSNHSSRRASMHEAQVSELEARLSAIEKKNFMLERAFLAVINTSAAYRDFGGGGRANVVDDSGERLSNGGPWNGRGGNGGARSSAGSTTESLYAGLENLLALHANEEGRRLSTSSGPP